MMVVRGQAHPCHESWPSANDQEIRRWHWFPRLWLSWVADEKAFKDMDNGFMVIEVSHSVLYLYADVSL